MFHSTLSVSSAVSINYTFLAFVLHRIVAYMWDLVITGIKKSIFEGIYE